MANIQTKVTKDGIDLKNRYRRTMTDLQSSISDIMSVSREMVQFIKVDPNAKKYGIHLSKILKTVQGMSDVINKIYVNKNMLNPEPVYVDKALEYILKERRGLAAYAKITVIEEYGAPQIKVVIDRTEFLELVKHALSNAQEAVAGGGDFTVRTIYQAEHKLIRIEIEDTGCGVSQSIRPHIFSKFFTTKEGKEGLGLTIINDTVQKYGGSLDLESSGEGKGALVTIILPENHDLFDEVNYYKKKFYYSGRVDAFVQKFMLGWGDDKVDALLAALCQVEAGYKCLGRDAVNDLLKQKKDFFLGRRKQ